MTTLLQHLNSITSYIQHFYQKIHHNSQHSYPRAAKYIAPCILHLNCHFFYNNDTTLIASTFFSIVPTAPPIIFSRKSETDKPTQKLHPLDANELFTSFYRIGGTDVTLTSY
jgi:hypothetical protein